MTGNEAYEQAISFLMEKPGEDSAFFENALNLINSALAELTLAQNSRKIHRGEKIGTYKIPSLADTLPVDDEVAAAVPLYLASHFLRDDLDDHNAAWFYTRFKEAKAALHQASFTDIEELYGDANAD